MPLRKAAHNMGYLEGLIDANASSDILVLGILEHIMANLPYRLISLHAEEQAVVAVERELWHQVTE